MLLSQVIGEAFRHDAEIAAIITTGSSFKSVAREMIKARVYRRALKKTKPKDRAEILKALNSVDECSPKRGRGGAE